MYLTNASGAVVWHGEQRPFGELYLQETDPDGNGVHLVQPFRFPGQYLDSETGLHYNYFRDYDPKLGRYIEADPIGQGGGWNEFSYSENGPINFIDPRGLNSVPMPFPVLPIVLPPTPDQIQANQALSDAIYKNIQKCMADAKLLYYMLACSTPGGRTALERASNENSCPPPDCDKLIERINKFAEEMEKKHKAILVDKDDLFKLTGRHPTSGYFEFHVRNYDGYWFGLLRMMVEAAMKGCPIPQKAFDVLSRSTPEWPY